MVNSIAKNKITNILYLITFLTSVHFAFVAYINSSYLANFTGKENLGVIYAIASVLSIIIISLLPSWLKRWGQFKTVISVLTIDLLAIIAMAATSSPMFRNAIPFVLGDGTTVLVENTGKLIPYVSAIAIISFLAFQISIVLNRILLDIYLEEFSKNSETGSNRGWFLTSINLAFVFSPFIVGKIATDANDGFWKVYLISAAFIAISLVAISIKLRHIKNVAYHSAPFAQTLRKIAKSKNILNIYGSALLLEFFYSWMVIYTPIYLHETVGFAWKEIGIIFSIMLTAFVIFELPLGKIADKYLGEKEILTAGFLVAAISTGLLTFINSKSLLVWSLALFATRVGASAIEVMNDTYFFKKVRPTDSDTISFFRNASPVAYIIGPTLASLMLYFTEPKYLFLILGAIMLSGIKFILSIKDTL